MRARIALAHLEAGEQLGDVGRIVLAVAVERGDPRRAGMSNAGADRGALPALLRVVQHAQLRHFALQRLERGERAVLRIIVDEDRLELDPAAQRGHDFPQQGADVVLLVEDRHDDG